MKRITIGSEQDTAALAAKMADLSQPGDVICLSGDLGAGKTTFTQYFAKALGIEDQVTSPTFTILHEYMGRLPLYHFDMYRIEDPYQLEDIGYEAYFFGSGVCVIEWPTQVLPLLPKDHLWLELEIGEGNQRKITMKGTNEYYQRKIEELCNG